MVHFSRGSAFHLTISLQISIPFLYCYLFITLQCSGKAVVEDVKKNAREFLGKDDYSLGDITKEIDSRVKDEVAKVRGKDEYVLGDFVLALDQISKSMTEEL